MGRPTTPGGNRWQAASPFPTLGVEDSASSSPESFVEPYYPVHDPTVKSISWGFARADGEAWALAGIWSEWQDKETGEIVPSYSMITQNCDGHPLMALMHRPERVRVFLQSR